MAKFKKGYVEQAANQPAPYRVYYTRNGKPYWDAMWAAGTDEAIAKLQAFAKQIGWRNVVVTKAVRNDSVHTTPEATR